MIKSMTGFGHAQKHIGARDITAEIKSVNHRYFDFSCRVPRNFAYLEDRLKTVAGEAVSRGKVEVCVSVGSDDSTPVLVRVNRPLLDGYMAAFREIKEAYPELSDRMTLLDAAGLNDVLSVEKQPDDEDAVWQAVKEVFDEAVEQFVSMRSAEGERLCADLRGRGEHILACVSELEKRAPVITQEYEARLRARIEELLGDAKIDENRVLSEVAIFADRVAINEELVRLRSHLVQYAAMLASDGPVGRKLDFLIQEMNREANTIGSKCNDLSASRIVVDIKAELEKIREQVQNIE